MKAEKTRELLDSIDCIACGYAKEMMDKGLCFHSCELHYRLEEAIDAELTELERLASKQTPTKPISLVSDVYEREWVLEEFRKAFNKAKNLNK